MPSRSVVWARFARRPVMPGMSRMKGAMARDGVLWSVLGNEANRLKLPDNRQPTTGN
jgi:hypothetical protein